VELKIEKKRMEDKTALINLEGILDLYTSPALKETVVEAISQGDVYLVIKLRKVRYMDSTGLAVLIGALKRSRERTGNLALVAPNSRIIKVLEMIDLVDIFCICSTMKEALEKVKVR